MTCATPQVEEPETKFPDETSEENDLPEADQKPTVSSAPPKAPPPVHAPDNHKISEKEQKEEVKEQCDEDGFGADNFGANFEAHFEANFEDAFTPQTPVEESPAAEEVPKQVVGGRASIPDELAPHQLARLQNLKESNA